MNHHKIVTTDEHVTVSSSYEKRYDKDYHDKIIEHIIALMKSYKLYNEDLYEMYPDYNYIDDANDLLLAYILISKQKINRRGLEIGKFIKEIEALTHDAVYFRDEKLVAAHKVARKNLWEKQNDTN